MNTNDYYTKKDIMLLFGYNCESSVRKLRNKVNTVKISNRYLYLRNNIDAILTEKYHTEQATELLKVLQSKIINHNIDLELWIPLKNALQIVSFSRQRLYQLIDRIETRQYDGFILFNKEKLLDFA